MKLSAFQHLFVRIIKHLLEQFGLSQCVGNNLSAIDLLVGSSIPLVVYPGG